MATEYDALWPIARHIPIIIQDIAEYTFQKHWMAFSILCLLSDIE